MNDSAEGEHWQQGETGESVSAPESGSSPETNVRPLSYWRSNHPAGWLSQCPLESADPIYLAGQVQRHLAAFLEWLQLPRVERWDAFLRQSLSAALFSRYAPATRSGPKRSQPVMLRLAELDWPIGTESIRQSIVELSELLAGPFAVFKAVRSALPADVFPTPAELQLAEDAVDAAYPQLRRINIRLENALRRFHAELRPSAVAKPAPEPAEEPSLGRSDVPHRLVV